MVTHIFSTRDTIQETCGRNQVGLTPASLYRKIGGGSVDHSSNDEDMNMCIQTQFSNHCPGAYLTTGALITMYNTGVVCIYNSRMFSKSEQKRIFLS
jgi:hypothetical protein